LECPDALSGSSIRGGGIVPLYSTIWVCVQARRPLGGKRTGLVESIPQWDRPMLGGTQTHCLEPIPALDGIGAAPAESAPFDAPAPHTKGGAAMKISISATNPCHLYPLAVELNRLGALGMYYSV